MKMLEEFDLFVDYAQILVFTASHPRPGLLWDDDHVAQGFAWASGIVSFSLPDHNDACKAVVAVSETSPDLDGDTIWAIQVPFQVSETLRIGTVLDTRPVNLPCGSFNLIFAARPGGGDIAFHIALTFVVADSPTFAILKPGGDISTDVVLRQSADLAG